jgi:hypothetical protein
MLRAPCFAWSSRRQVDVTRVNIGLCGDESGLPAQGIAPFPWEEEQTEMALCGNTCAAASNGVCDEGRLSNYAAVLPHSTLHLLVVYTA